MSKDNLFAMRHSAAHILAAALLELYPGTKLGVGPVIEHGFYYDVQLPEEKMLTDEDLPKIEKKMKEIIKRGDDFVKSEMSINEAINFFKEKGQDFKVELLEGLKEKGTTAVHGDEAQDIDVEKPDVAGIYTTGDFVDLCRGPHVSNSKDIGEIKLTKLAGAYWRGDEKNPQLQRVYGIAFQNSGALDAHLAMLEEAAKRDHRKVGKELDLFVFSDLVGSGLPLWTAKGTIIREELDAFVWELRKARGYERVEIPHITKKELYEVSGHWDKFSDELFKIKSREGHEFAMKPMNCPHHTQIYAAHHHSYRDLPVRYANTTVCYRDEQTGELHGIMRTRAFTQDDAHVFCRVLQAKEEFLKIWDIIDQFYGAFGLELSVRLSLHDPKKPDKYLGGPDLWKQAETHLREIAKERGVEAEEVIGEAAFYGPKVDFISKDSLGRLWQVATIQLDINLPERFDLTCVNEKSEDERIVMIHAAIMGSIERFVSALLEHTAGALPLWLSPVQVSVISVGSAHVDAVNELSEKLGETGARVHADTVNETVGNKIRKASKQKIPYVLVIGDKEVGSDTLTIRVRGQEDLLELSVDEFIERLKKEIHERLLTS